MWTKIWTFCVIFLLYGGNVRCTEERGTPDRHGVLQFLRNILSKDSQQSQIFEELALGRSRRDAAKECGGTVPGVVGSLQSPGFPRGYAQDLLCVWKIEAPASKQLLLRFMFFDVKGGSRGICNPGEDYVMMRDGSRSGRLLGIFCNALLSKSSLPSSILSVDNKVWIIFHTNSKDEGKGFRISFQSVNSVKFSDYIADQITFEPTTEVGSSSAGRPSTEVKTTAAPTTSLPQSSVNPATTFPLTQEGDQLTPTAGDTFSFGSVAIGNPRLGSMYFGDSKGSFVDYTVPPVSDAPLSLTDLREGATATRTKPHSTSQLQTTSSTDGATLHRVLETEQPVTPSREQFAILAKSFVVTVEQQEATETVLLPVARTEQASRLQSERESVSPPDWQPVTGVEQRMLAELQTETQAVKDTQVEQKITARVDWQPSTKATQLRTPAQQLIITEPRTDEPGPVATSAGQFVSSTEEPHASKAYHQPTTKSQEQFVSQTQQPSLPEFEFLKPVAETKLLTTLKPLPITVPGQYSVTQIRDASEAKQQSVSKPDLRTMSWRQFVAQMEELPVTEVTQEPLTKPDEPQPTTKLLTTEQETIPQTKQPLSTSNLIPTTKPGSQFVTQTEELTSLNGLQQLTSSGQQVLSRTGKLTNDATQQPVTKPDGHQPFTRLWKQFIFPTRQPSVTEIDDQEAGIQTGKQVGTDFYKTQTLTKYGQHFVISTIAAMAKTDVQQPVTQAEQLLTEIYELKPVIRRWQQFDSPTGPPGSQNEDTGTKEPTQMFTHQTHQTYQEQVSTSKYQPKSTTEISVQTVFSDEPKETVSQQHLPTPAESSTSTEHQPDVETQWQAPTKEQRKPSTTDSPEAEFKQFTVPPSPPPTPPPPPYSDITPEPRLTSEDFDDPLTQSVSQVFSILGNVNLHDERSIIQACRNLNVTMNKTLEAFKSLSGLAQGLEYTKSLLTASIPVEMLSVNLSGEAALDNEHLFPFLLVQTLEVSVSEIISKASEFLNYTVQNASRIQSDIPEASCIQGYSQQLLNALQRDESINGSLDLVADLFEDLFGFDITERLGPGLGIDDDRPTLAPDSVPWDFNQVITNPSGELQSPDYPDAYPMGVRYRWNITVTPQRRIALSFTHFDLDSAVIDNQCDRRYAHVTVEDGSGLETGRKQVFCGQDVPNIIVSSSNTIIVTFISSYGYGTGFHADFGMLSLGDVLDNQYSKTVVPDQVCGGVLTKQRGSIKSPSYPGDFETSVDCQWIVTVESGLTISLNFTDFNMDSIPFDNWCSESYYAHVKIIDGDHGRSHVYCGQQVPPLFISSTNTLTVSFVSMFGYGGRFYAFYKTLQQDSKPLLTSSLDVPSTEPPHSCGGNLEDPTGIIQSPNYPGDFETGVDCQWIVTVESGLTVSLNFTDFNLDSFPIDNWCNEGYAHVKVIDGDHRRSHVYCGQQVPPLFISSTNTLTVSFVSMFGYGGRFYAFYKTLQQDSKPLLTSSPDVPSTELPHPCGGNLEDPTGVIQSPNYPGDFETGVDCLWIVTVESGLTVSLSFTDFNLDSFPIDNWCNEGYAHVKIIDGDHGSSHVYCGQQVPPLFISSTNTLTVSFVSMFGYGGRFYAFYKTLQQDSKPLLTSSLDVPSTEPPHLCGGNLEDPTGVIQSPNYPGDFETGVDCQWIVTVESGLTVSLNFTDFNLDSFPIDNWCNEGYAHVKVIDGDHRRSHVYCGQQVPPLFISSTNTLTVSFVSMFGYGGRFHAVYTALQQDSKVLLTSPPDVKQTDSVCGGNFNNPRGVVRLPDYWGVFELGLSCQWNITVDITAVISLTFTEFNLDSLPIDNKCNEGYAHVKVVDGNLGKSNIYCGQELPPPFVSTTNTLLVVFDSLYGYSGRFQAVYHALQTDGSGSGDPKLGMTPSQPSSMSVTEPLCGGAFNQPSGVIQLLEQTGDNCRWNITVESGWIILLTFTAFDIDSYSVEGQCDESYAHVKVMDRESTYIFCGQNVPPKVTSKSRMLIVDYIGLYGLGEGFQAFYTVREADFGWLDGRQVTAAVSSPSISTQAHLLIDKSSYQCGGDLNLPYGTIQSPSSFGEEQVTGMTCRWNITAGDTRLIQLAFTDFNLDSASVNGQCDQRYDYLKIVDVKTEDGSSEFVYCGQDMPNVYVSSSNYLIVIFYTSYGYGGGFTAEYTVREPDRILTNTLSPSTSKLSPAVLPYECGGDISTPTGEIKSPNFPGVSTTGVNCVWKITSEASSKVALSFTVFDVDSMPFDNECDTRYAHVLVIDGSSEETSPQRIYCGQDLPDDFLSTGNSMIIAFISQFGYGGRFQARYSSLKLDDDYFKLFPSTSTPSDKTVSQLQPTSKTDKQIVDCGGILDSPDGVIQSPYLSTMEKTQSVNCHWYIKLQEAGTITVVFEYFDLDSVLFESGCEEVYAHVKIINTGTGASQVYCGQDLPPSFVASTNELSIIFSGLYGFSRGFRAEYHYSKPLPHDDPTTVTVLPTSGSASGRQLPSCGSTLRGDYAEFSSPGYPNSYPVDTNCLWSIVVDSTHFIALKFLDFDVDNPMVQSDCSIHYSYVRVSYPGEGGIEETHLLCGSEQPEIMKMRTHSAVVYFESNLGMGRGFKASYQAYSLSSSDGRTTAMPAATESVLAPLVLTAQSGQILSPNYPVQFPHNIDKLWIIRPAHQTFITLMLEDIDFDATTDENGQCNALYTHVALTMYNIHSGNSELLICSSDMKTTVYSYGELKLEFHSTYGVGRGFKATYWSDIRTGDVGFVTKDPVTPIPRHSQPRPSKESVMKTRNPGEEFSEGCMYTLTQGRGHFSSPNYPSMYPQELACQWIMLAPAGWLVRLDFSQFLLDSDDFHPCDTKYSHLVVTTTDSYGGRDYTYCGQQLPPRIVSPTNRLVVTFRSMFGVDFGFVAAYQFISAQTYQGSFGPVFTDGDKITSATSHGSDAGKTTPPMSSQEAASATRVTEGSLISDAPCERVFSSPEGVIRSPYFPQGMPQGEECTWTITVPGEQGIHLTFLEFYLDDYEIDTSTCSEDSASVSVLMDGSHYEFCGNVPPSPLVSTESSVIIELKTMSGNGPGFRMHFIDASLVSPDLVTSHITGDITGEITESGTSIVDFRFLEGEGMTAQPDGDKRDFTRPDRERVNVPVLQSEDPLSVAASTSVSNVETEFGMTATVNTMTTVNKDNIATLPGYTFQAKMTSIGSTAASADVLTSHQLSITAYVCSSVSFILFILLVLLTTICIYKRRRRHSSQSVKMGQSEKNYWQNYKSWAREYTGGPNKPEAADEEGVEAAPIPEQERLV